MIKFQIRLFKRCQVFYSTQLCKVDAQYLSEILDVPKCNAEYIYLKYPLVCKLNQHLLQSVISTACDLGLNKQELVTNPRLLGIHPVTLRNRYTVLKECGFHNITARQISTYLFLMKRKTIGELKQSELINSTLNLENRLATYMTQWPTSLTTSILFDVNQEYLHTVRLKIIKEYLALVLELKQEEFYRALETYPSMKHFPLQLMNETMMLLLNKIMMPAHKIKSNMYLIYARPDNLKHLLYDLKSIAGIDIKEILRLNPKLCMTDYAKILEIQNLLKEFGFSDEAQMKCFEIYTLSFQTIKERLLKARELPEIKFYFNHPRFLKIIFYNKNATKRLFELQNNNNKRCISLNILCSSQPEYVRFCKSPGDRTGKGKDLVYSLSQHFGKQFSKKGIRNILMKHPFWINIPVVHVNLLYEKLSKSFTDKDIYENCPVLLYPLNMVKNTLTLFNRNNFRALCTLISYFEQIEIDKLTNSQKLSLAVYLLERNHYFSGNGIWNNLNIKDGRTKPNLKEEKIC